MPSETETVPQQIFRQHENMIPDFTENPSVSDVNIETPSEENSYHCITTKNKQVVKGKNVVKPETIAEMVRKLDDVSHVNADDQDNLDVENKEFVTKEKLSVMIGDFRVDVLSMCNLIGCLNNNVTACDNEISRLKQDIIKLVNDNKSLKQKLLRVKEDNDKRYARMVEKYDENFDNLVKRLNKLEGINPNTISSSRVRNTNRSNKDNVEQNLGLIDSQIDKRVNKFKVVPRRSLKSGRDNFGSVQRDQKETIHLPSTRQVSRKNNLNNTSKKPKNTRQYRINRLGLQDMYSDEDRLSVKRQ
jgi:hypothetical protein